MDNVVTMICGSCREVLGEFVAMDDHSGVTIKCCHCGEFNDVHNQALSHPDEWQSDDQGRLVALPTNS